MSAVGPWQRAFACSDVFRTYDTAGALSIPQTLDRVQALLQISASVPGAQTEGSVQCGSAAPNQTLQLSCPKGQAVRRVLYASYGRHDGGCLPILSRHEIAEAAAPLCDTHPRCVGFQMMEDNVVYHECDSAPVLEH